ncbi:MAG: thioredoxin domain-containing protein [Cyanobacteria bacterium P01_A01_bin.37]
MASGRSEPPAMRRIGVTFIVLIGFAIATFFLTRPVTASSSMSPVSGLVMLKAMAQASVPYEEAIASGKPTFMEFYADWCTTCQSMASTVAELHTHYGADLNFVMLNIDDPKWRSQVEQFHVGGVPEYFLLDNDQSIHRSFIGRVPYGIMAQSVNNLIN